MPLLWKIRNVQSSEASFNVLVVNVSVVHRYYRNTSCYIMWQVNYNMALTGII